MKKLKLAGACLNQTPFDWSHNKKNILNAIQSAQSKSIELLCLPELCITAYGCEDMFLSEWLPKSALNLLIEIIPNTKNIAVAIGLPLSFEHKLYNAVCLIENKTIKGFYCKQILANEGVHYETRWFTPWEPQRVENITINGETYPLGDITFDCKGIKIGFEICEDAWHENRRPAINYKKQSIDLILNPSASHFAFNKAEFREELVRKSSDKYNCVYLYTNLLGNEAGRLIYDGDIIFAQKGKIIQRNKRLSFKNLNVCEFIVDFDNNTPTEIDRLSLTREEEFTQASSLALFDYLRKSWSNGFVLSLSGGADSSTCAILVSEMYKRANKELSADGFKKKLPHIEFKTKGLKQLFTCAYQGTKNSTEETFEAAHELAKEINANFHVWKIDDEVNSYTQKVEKALGRKLNWETDDISLQNIQARSRSPIIWMFANIHNCLLYTSPSPRDA